MASLQSIAIASALFLILLVHQGDAIRCFECNSHNDTRCSQPIPPSDLSIECGDHKHGVQYTFCRKIVQVIEFSVNSLPPDERVIRGCGWEDSSYKNRCYNRAGFGGRQEVCSCYDDNCNGASTLSLAFGALCATLLVIYNFF